MKISYCSLLFSSFNSIADALFFLMQLTGLIVIDLRTKYIAGYYIMIIVCNYCSFLGFYKILT